ncbi:hypothetical protein [Spirochaeta isovalerica]|uniref:Ferredoxin--NADP+ reductase n=1 Tax=Spirochaeta isovalerica TaxID=150 RepID=A0A841RHR1_9SPIO|nr:hypothetical protein [Spirochaeta isovalerica]MBB6481842.1 ferredoxin--NADP+ reductase [Spirochaeta isovalerica]
MSEKKDITAEHIEIISIERNDDITFTFRCTRPENLIWETGANGHFSLKPPTGVKEIDKDFQRHMSIVSYEDEPFLEFTTRIRSSASDFKTKLSGLKKGDGLFVYGLNNRMPLIREGRNLVFITMGVAISTCRPYIRDYEVDPRGILSFSCLNIDKTGKSYFMKQMEEHTAEGFSFRFFSDRADFYKGIDETLSKADNFYYIIGSDQFLADTGRYLLDRGVAGDAISIDKKYGIEKLLEGK